jgi:hypothetical protein
VRVDQSRHQRRAREIDRRRPSGRADLTARTSGDDLVAGDEHRPAGMRRGLDAVPHAVGNEQGGGDWSSRRPDTRLCRSYARDGRNRVSDQQYQRTRTHDTLVVSDEG